MVGLSYQLLAVVARTGRPQSTVERGRSAVAEKSSESCCCCFVIEGARSLAVSWGQGGCSESCHLVVGAKPDFGGIAAVAGTVDSLRGCCLKCVRLEYESLKFYNTFKGMRTYVYEIKTRAIVKSTRNTHGIVKQTKTLHIPLLKTRSRFSICN